MVMQDEVVLRVTYRVAAHHTRRFEELLAAEVIPLAQRLGIECRGVWRTFVGPVGQYMELWAFPDLATFQQRWKALLEHPALQRIFEETGPMVQDEEFTLLEPLPSSAVAEGGDRLRV